MSLTRACEGFRLTPAVAMRTQKGRQGAVNTRRPGAVPRQYHRSETVKVFAPGEWRVPQGQLHLFVKMTNEAQSLQKMQQLPASDSPITPDQQCTLQALVKARVESIPKAERPKGLYPQIWSRFNNHFRIARYCQLPQSRLSEAIEYLTRMDLAPALPASAPLPAPKQDIVPAWDEMPMPADMDKLRARICRELYELQEKFGCLVDDIRICLNPGGRLLRLPPELDNAYETLAALNRVATGGAYTARQAILSAYHIGKGLKFV